MSLVLCDAGIGVLIGAPNPGTVQRQQHGERRQRRQRECAGRCGRRTLCCWGAESGWTGCNWRGKSVMSLPRGEKITKLDESAWVKGPSLVFSHTFDLANISEFRSASLNDGDSS